ncbi:hypothetical protein MWU75_19455, partial [Ornithinimicrobium sp. F0845]|uniref:hypothetical protein n=1 Tax=Ornithinimicrobium sp. F0845 TaxID=2926412 RepID=UPI001FF38809
MEQQTILDSGARAAAEGAASGAAGGGRVRYVPLIGTGPLRLSNAGPLVPEPDQGSMPSAGDGGEGTGAGGRGVDRGVELTSSGHEVPEFLAGSAHMTQMLAGEFPLASLPEVALGEVVGAAQALVQAAQ